jgi:hypothetical protein
MAVVCLSIGIQHPSIKSLTITSVSGYLLLTAHGSGILTFAILFATLILILLFQYRRNYKTLFLVIATGIIITIFCFPNLYVTKIKNKNSTSFLAHSSINSLSIEKVREKIKRKENIKGIRFFKDLLPVSKELYIYGPQTYLKVDNLIKSNYIGILGILGLPLLWHFIPGRTRFLIFAAGVISAPLFLSNPYFVTYGKKIFTLYQIHRFGVRSIFIKIALLLTVFFIFEVFSNWSIKKKYGF